MARLDQVEVFLRVVERGSFTAAARQLDIPVSAVSRKIKALEEDLGVQLLHRTTRHVSVTESGRAYYDRSVTAVQMLSCADASIRALRQEPEGRLRVLAPPAFGILILEPVLGDFRRRYPNVQLLLTLDNHPHDLIQGGFDVAVRSGPIADSSYVARMLGHSPSVIVAGPDYLARRGTPKHPRELSGHDLIAIAPEATQIHWRLEKGGEATEIVAEPVLWTNDPVVAVRQVARGEGITLLSEALVRRRLTDGEVVPVLPQWRPARGSEMAVLFPRNATLDLKVRVFVDFLVEAVERWEGASRDPGAPVAFSEDIRKAG